MTIRETDLVCPVCRAWIGSIVSRGAAADVDDPEFVEGDVIICYRCRRASVWTGVAVGLPDAEQRDRMFRDPDVTAALFEALLKDMSSLAVLAGVHDEWCRARGL